MAAARVGFFGLGRMGAPMAANLLRAGFAVAGFDLHPQAGAELAGQPEFERAAAVEDAVRDADVVILMLSDSEVVDALLWGAAGLASKLKRGTLLIDMGSSDPLRTRSNAERLAGLGVALIDAPVSGGVKRAVDGTLTIMSGGAKDAVESARPMLQAMGRTIFHVGGAGAGHAVKALNN
jgi:3-hydroxyisobutyrate dehydrogenase